MGSLGKDAEDKKKKKKSWVGGKNEETDITVRQQLRSEVESKYGQKTHQHMQYAATEDPSTKKMLEKISC